MNGNQIALRPRRPSRHFFAPGAFALAILALLGGQAFGEAAITPPQVTASSVYVLNADTGRTLYQKNDSKLFRLLSITKLVTAYVLMQRMGGRLDDNVTITPADLVPGSTAGLRKDDVWTLENLAYGMLLVSGNDAALAIADRVGRNILTEENKSGSSIKRFVQEMKSAATALGAKNAQFADPYGISPADVATARDVAVMGRTIFRDERLLPFWRCAQRTFNVGGPNARPITITSSIEMLGEPNVLGAKTGTHVGNKIYNLVVAWRAPNGQTIVVVVLGAADDPSRYKDVRTILAALPRDFPELAQPASASTAVPAGACR